jgi:hypothetical protein
MKVTRSACTFVFFPQIVSFDMFEYQPFDITHPCLVNVSTSLC